MLTNSIFTNRIFPYHKQELQCTPETDCAYSLND